jgi:hypothetical protein
MTLQLCALDKAPEPILEPRGHFEGEAAGGDDRPERFTIQDGYHFGSVLYDPLEARFRYWYNPAARHADVFDAATGGPLPPDGSLATCIAYAASVDGLEWERPELGLVHHPFGGSPNLSVLARPPVCNTLNPSVVPLPAARRPLRPPHVQLEDRVAEEEEAEGRVEPRRGPVRSRRGTPTFWSGRHGRSAPAQPVRRRVRKTWRRARRAAWSGSRATRPGGP